MGSRTSKADETLVPLMEVAARVGMTEDAIMAQLNGEVVRDWANRAAIVEPVARKLVEARDAAREAEERREMELQIEHRAWLADRTARRRAAVHEAYESALKKAFAEQMEISRKINSGEIKSEWATGAFPILGQPELQTQSVARSAGTQAARDFDAKHPPHDNYYEWREALGKE